ncbi:MAG: radical SAM protein [Syntrophaceae bacterium]|nr:radical SAM protein [Syntrophaceae bacterium]
MEPSYRELYRRGELERRTEAAVRGLEECRLCPRSCGRNRLAGETGYCRTGRKARIAGFHAHFGEEAPLVGSGGSGTIFISSCNLLCTFCQNDDISHSRAGDDLEPIHLAAMMLSLQERGCPNINFVTPSHVVPQILEGLMIASEHGLSVPLVYNTGGYDSVETLRLLDGIVDIYMPDFKFWDNAWAERFCGVKDYRERACEAIREMHRQVGDLYLDGEGIAVRGLLVRHLVMPGGAAGTTDVMAFLAGLSPYTYVNVMDQYHPCGRGAADPLINRRITAQEYASAVRAARDSGLHRLDNRERRRRL